MPAGTNPRLALPLVFDATNNTFQIDEGGGALNVTIPAGTYYWLDDGSASDLCAVLKTSLNAAVGGALTYTVVGTTYPGVLTIWATGAWTLLFGTGVHLLDPLWLGFTDADHASTGAPNHAVAGTMQVQSLYVPEQAYIEDTEDCPVYSVAHAWSMSGRNVGLAYGSRTFRSISIDQLPPRKVFQSEEVRVYESFQRVFSRIASGVPFYFMPNEAVPDTRSLYVIRDPRWANSALDGVCLLHEQIVRRYRLTLPMQLYVAS